ncbi:hypothetical protein K0M31_006902 [Melipona bicolor]|uniref:Uncharacterized protein n=2 Tax=Melipona bicolor TaxID=60889 RepID=A0AA40KDR7_9HYME|nr:hypothetical protein K0M31_006553 [Melipona bicolor]KAK1116382.1 hypothetical protein K0M31_004155 [Melipona bicolor]KAK1116383.1 hypothetical protein K0M31_004156 [Melipona bicolor]KAK1116384.1 hypothetical protein K0M31_004157 [Melipona bicolor]KAK1116385.1 hypothetical protein K0M31_004158 [Melipona bicolor]
MAESRRTARLAADVGTANKFGLRFEYKSARVSGSETHIHAKPVEKSIKIGGSSSLRRRNEEMEPFGATTGPEFHKAEYEAMLNEYYEDHSPAISRQVLEASIVDTLKRNNAESELTDFLGFGAMEFIQYIIENRACIVALKSYGLVTPKFEEFEEEKQRWKCLQKVDRRLNKVASKRERKRRMQ